MKGQELLEKMDLVDWSYVEAADRESLRGKTSRRSFRSMAAGLAAAVVLLSLGVTAFASGAFGSIELYFKGNAPDYMDQLIRSTRSVSDGGMTLRVDGAIADAYCCHMVVSLRGLSEQELENACLKAWAVTKEGQRVDFWNWGQAISSEGSGFWKRRWSRFEDADITFVLKLQFDGEHTMEQMDRICVSYADLLLEVAVSEYLVTAYPVETGESGFLKNVCISPLGLYLDARQDAVRREGDMPGLVRPFEIFMIRRDGTVVEDTKQFGLAMDITYNDDDAYIHMSGSWRTKMSTIYILDLSDFCGVQINGRKYYFDR